MTDDLHGSVKVGLIVGLSVILWGIILTFPLFAFKFIVSVLMLVALIDVIGKLGA